MDFSQITTRLFTGAAVTDPTDAQALSAAGVTHIIDCRIEFDDQQVLGPPFAGRYLWIGVPDDGTPKPVSWFAQGVQFALAALAQPHNRVYVHCAAGQNRGPSMCYAVMRALGFTSADALDLIHTGRPVTIDHVRYAPDADTAIAALGYA